jgi:hypothetical protein
VDIGIPIHTDPLNIVEPLEREGSSVMRVRRPNDESLTGKRLIVPFDEYGLVTQFGLGFGAISILDSTTVTRCRPSASVPAPVEREWRMRR